MPVIKRRYVYDGAVSSYDRVICDRCAQVVTWASSASKAESNVKFQLRKRWNMANYVPLKLLDPIRESPREPA